MNIKSFFKKSIFIIILFVIVISIFLFFKEENIRGYVSGVAPHHLLADLIIENCFNELSKENYPQKIILIGPDHFNAAGIYGNNLITVSTSTNNLNNLSIDSKILNLLSKSNNFSFSNYAIKSDHGITNILPFIKKYFPKTEIIPFLIPANFSIDKAKNITRDLHNILPDESFVLASVDWSHYLPKNVADFHDKKSIRVFLNFEEKNFPNIEVDCPQCLYISRYFATLRNANNYKEIGYKNSQDFLGGNILDNTTSYYSALFSKQENISNNNNFSKTILFLGDIVLDESVKKLIDKNNLLYPIDNIKIFLKGVDILVSNLEYPIVLNPALDKNNSENFNLDLKILDLLKYTNINLVSLINNNILYKDILFQIKEFLNAQNINYFGDSTNCNKENIYKKDNVAIIGLNRFSIANCSEKEIKFLIESINDDNTFVVAFIRWEQKQGYKATNSAEQRNLAYLMIDNGVDLIIGSHSHIVEEVEKYKGKLIFYSLGNFIFKQDSPEKDQESLAVGLEFNENKAFIYFFPLGPHNGQPYLLDNVDKVEFLENLSLKSSTVPREQIMSGKIIIDTF